MMFACISSKSPFDGLICVFFVKAYLAAKNAQSIIKSTEYAEGITEEFLDGH